MKRLSEFKSGDNGYRLSDLKAFFEYVEAEKIVETTETQELLSDLIKAGKLGVFYAEHLDEWGGW
jgi:hypothetical protein